MKKVQAKDGDDDRPIEDHATAHESRELPDDELEAVAGGAKVPYTQGRFAFQVDGASDQSGINRPGGGYVSRLRIRRDAEKGS